MSDRDRDRDAERTREQDRERPESAFPNDDVSQFGDPIDDVDEEDLTDETDVE